jgi:hypothetical protein
MRKPQLHGSSTSPDVGRMTFKLAHLLIATVARLAGIALALHTLVLEQLEHNAASWRSRPPVAQLESFRKAAYDSMTCAATQLRTFSREQQFSGLRPTYSDLAGELADDNPLKTLLDRLVDTTNTLNEIVRSHVSS